MSGTAQQASAAGSGITPPPGGGPKISVRGLSKAFAGATGSVVALEDISLEVREGEFWCLVGPSGCGKSTLLRVLAGLESHSTGTFEIATTTSARPLTSMVFQEHSAFPWMNVRANIGYGLDMRGVPRAERDGIVSYYLDSIGLRPFASALPHQLSGGMRQRVCLARAFANDPEVLLMDEPFAGLDEQNKILMQEELLRVWERGERKTVLFVTHSIDEAIVLADAIVVMTAQPGRVKRVIPVPFARPRDVAKLRAEPAFGRLQYDIWELLRDEVLRARAGEDSAHFGSTIAGA